MAVYKVINKAGSYRNEDAAERLLSYITSPLKTEKTVSSAVLLYRKFQLYP